MQSEIKGYYPYQIPKTSQLTPDNPKFHQFDLNYAILTKYGRYIFIRHGNEQRCSSFFATLATIVNKLQLSFGSEENPAQLKKFQLGILTFFVLRRMNFMYIIWSKSTKKQKSHSQLQIYSMIDFVHYQLLSCLTAKVNTILDTNQTYDPSINFGKGRSVFNLLQYATQNGLYSLPIMFNANPVAILSNQLRSQVQSIINIKDFKEEGLQIAMIITMNSVVAISKKKGIDIQVKDTFLFFNLLQSQSTLATSENWFPICLPGIQDQSMVFCYLNFLDKQIIHIMISDEASIFPRLSQINKEVKLNLQSTGLLNRINQANSKDLIDDPSLERTNLIKHFVVRNNSLQQMVMSKGQYFGDNIQLNPQFKAYISVYSQLYRVMLTGKYGRKEKLHVQTFEKEGLIGGYYDQGSLQIFFIISRLCDFQEAKGVIMGVLKLMKEEQASIFIAKYY